MQSIFVIHHMKRSGGHAVINWLVNNTPGAKFFNNDIPINPILAGHCSVPIVPLPYAEWLARHGGDLQSMNEASTVLVSLEDHELWVRPFDLPTAQTIVILRHPQNLFASRIRKAANCPHMLAYHLADSKLRTRAARIWKEHARAALSGADGGQPLTAIFYEAWLTSEGYRAKLAHHFNLAALHNPFEHFAEEGGGSSFGQVDINPADLIRRADFLDAAEKAILVTILSDPEIAELADSITAEVARLCSFGRDQSA